MRAYVTGGTGFVGSNIVKVFAERHRAEVHCPVHRFVPADASGFTTERLDLLDDDALLASVASFVPDVIVHSMILNGFAAMYADRDLAWRSYVGTTETLARAADEVGAKLIGVSTDWVFDGTQSGADEDTPPNPVNLYGVLKMASEQAAMLTAQRAAVARVSAVSGMHWMRDSTPRVQDGGFGYCHVDCRRARGRRDVRRVGSRQHQHGGHTVDGPGRILHVTPESAGWDYVEFGVVEVAQDAPWSGVAADRETAIVPLAGQGRVCVGDELVVELSRSSVFEEMARIVYLPPGVPYRIESETATAGIGRLSAGRGPLPGSGVRAVGDARRDPRRRPSPSPGRALAGPSAACGAADPLRGVRASGNMVGLAPALPRRP